MTTQQIKYFLETANCLNFSDAAHKLFISQPALSKQIAQMEDEVGVPLFTRTTRTVKLTPSGVILRAELVKIDASLGSAIQRAQQEVRGTEGSLSVCILDLLNPEHIILPALEMFQTQHPKVKVDLMFCGFRRIRECLDSNSVDVAFNTFYEAVSTIDVNYLPLYHAPKMVYMAKSHKLANRDSLTFAELKAEFFIVLEALECPGELKSLVEEGERAGFFPRIAKYTINNFSRLLHVSKGYGIAVMDGDVPTLPWMDIAKVSLVSEIPPISPEGDIVLTWRSKPTNPAFFQFRDIIRDLIG